MRIWNLAKVVFGGLVAVLAPLSAVHAQNTLSITYYTLSASDPDAGKLAYGTFNNEVQNALGPDGLPVLNTAQYGCTSNCFDTNTPVPSDVNAAGEIRYWDVTSPYVSLSETAVVELPFNVPANFFPPNGTGSADGSGYGYQAAVLSGQLIVPSTEFISFALAADDMAFVYVDGQVVCALGGVHTINPSGTCTSPSMINAGTHTIQLFYTDIQTVQAGLVFSITTPGVETTSLGTMTYTYTGHGFTKFECSTSPTTDCPAPGPGNNYTTKDSVTAGLTLASALGANSGPVSVTSLPGFQLTISDGLNTATVGGNNATAWLMTDSKGNVSAWYLSAPGSGSGDPYTVYDPNGSIYAACEGCYPNAVSGKSTGEDYGSYGSSPIYYAYNLNSPGSFAPPGAGGIVQLSSCTTASPGMPASLTCNPTGLNPFSSAGPNTAAIPAGATLTQQLCLVNVDPRGPNCGMGANYKGIPKELRVDTVCPGFSKEVIPFYICGASGGTAFALIRGVGEQYDAINGLYMPQKQIISPLPSASPLNPELPCIRTGGAYAGPYGVTIEGTRFDSLTEEQDPELSFTFPGLPLVAEVTDGCDPEQGTRSSGSPGGSITGFGFKNLLDDPVTIQIPGTSGLTRVDRMVWFANYKILNLNIILANTKFPSVSPPPSGSVSPPPSGSVSPPPSWLPVGTNGNLLKACVNKITKPLNQKNQLGFQCAAEQVYRCESIVDAQAMSTIPPSTTVNGWTAFGPSSFHLRLPDPYGDILRRLGSLYYTINTSIAEQIANVDWPLLSDPYPSCPAL